MEKILFLAHAEPGNGLAKASLEVLTAAKSLAQQIPDAQWFVGFVGSSAQKCANEIAACGASKFLAVTGADFDVSRYATDAAAAEALCKATGATLVIAPGTSRWMRTLPGVAQRLGGSVDTHVISLTATGGKLAVQRWFYRQRMEGSLTRQQRPWVILVDPGTQPAWEGAPGTATVEQVTAATTARTTLVGYREPAGDAKTLRPEAELLLVTGAGWTKKQADGQPHVKEAEKLIADCLKLTRASLGSTKSLVDLGGEGQAVLSFLTHLNQVGQTGSTPRHRKGLATCCHGEEPHTVGWRFITERRAVNLDPGCGWARGKADVLYVADAFAVVSKLNELLSKSAS
jgi:electron transfer flavoprotein alpha subunit